MPMYRRRFLQSLAAAVTVVGSKRVFAAGANRVLVIGAGIMGASIAYHLAKRGAQVTLFDRTGPAAGTTRNSFAWLNSSGKSPRTYYELNYAGMLGWQRLKLEIGSDLPLQLSGAVSWGPDTAGGAVARKRRLAERESWGYPIYEVTADEIAKLLPGVVTGDFGYGQFCNIEGTIDPVAAATVLTRKAKELGANVVYPCEITGLDLAADRIQGVQTTQGKFEADYVVVAAGNDTPRISAMAGFNVPLIESKGILAHSKPQARCLDRVMIAPLTDAKQHLDGRIVTGQDFGDSGDVQPTMETGQKYFEILAKYLPAAASAQVEFMTLGHRVMPKDGHPIIDRAPKYSNMYIAAQHSGMTCAPIVGQLVSMEVLDQVSVDMLEPYRLSRFA
jgi:glycine/D-amino acid oxidase-like deaminating enzyme